MEKSVRWLLLAAGGSMLITSGVAALSVLQGMPENGSLKSGQVVYVANDGRCQAGWVLRVTGGSRSKGIKRQVVCVPNPGQVE
ncbi:MAG: hypothetical protein KDI68_09720 [Gammaproteobacteria bacterium]|nr:hypothetical protein [Gammaproteobacteria bacterium]